MRHEEQQDIIDLPEQRPAIRPDEDPAGHVCGLIRMLTEPAGGEDRNRPNAYFRQPY